MFDKKAGFGNFITGTTAKALEKRLSELLSFEGFFFGSLHGVFFFNYEIATSRTVLI